VSQATQRSTVSPSMRRARTVADAVLYEGYLLYPYRATSSKNQVRWQFGVLGPPAAPFGVGEEPAMRADCLLRVADRARLTLHLRFLQVQVRGTERIADEGYQPVPELHAAGRSWLAWDEAVERELAFGPVELACADGQATFPVELPGGCDVEEIADEDGAPAGRLVRRRWPLQGVVRLSWAPAGPNALLRLRVVVENTDPGPVADRDDALRRSFIGAHQLLAVDGGEFVSTIDPPPDAAQAAAGCESTRGWPVLAGAEGATDVVLVSPIILYDHPSVAPESAVEMYDSTEIDEILTLRVMTLTDEEKASARATDARAAAIIDRCDDLSPDSLALLHGALRNPHGTSSALPKGEAEADVPWWDPGVDASVSPETDSVLISGVPVAKGSRVRLHPTRRVDAGQIERRSDAHDLFFVDRVATVSGVFNDVDGEVHVAVTLVDDPAADLHDWYGRYLYFAPEEVEPLDPGREDITPTEGSRS
jgi:hypothetical protein